MHAPPPLSLSPSPPWPCSPSPSLLPVDALIHPLTRSPPPHHVSPPPCCAGRQRRSLAEPEGLVGYDLLNGIRNIIDKDPLVSTWR